LSFGAFVDFRPVIGTMASVPTMPDGTHPFYRHPSMSLASLRAVGDSAEIRALAPPDARVNDVGGRLVVATVDNCPRRLRPAATVRGASL
jgi:hypothetical protein